MEQEILVRLSVIFICDGETKELIGYDSDRSREQIIQNLRDCYGDNVIILSVEKVVIH